MAFRDLIADIDEAVFDTLSDAGTIEGRPVAGMFSVPWLQPRIGRQPTALREPSFVIRVNDADGVEKAQTVEIDLPVKDGGGRYTVIGVEPGGDGLVTLVLRIKP
ncbi:hypothetical protein NJC40_08735 [Pseudomonas sp. 21LCFQ02]|uniref:head-tail joining protein n=1 Tax=Pseudomonas sp. 21LCFQ02 TaxID=2957505 RepID=UPI00209B0CF5|nr:hypothetical protein [Pseudomonas sp. 21LCFQ02]MCO8167863.1 hypothetical protein [Pseudomonas sp. 21LCFQ02]